MRSCHLWAIIEQCSKPDMVSLSTLPCSWGFPVHGLLNQAQYLYIYVFIYIYMINIYIIYIHIIHYYHYYYYV